MPGIAELVAGILRPLVDLVAQFHMSPEEKAKLQVSLAAAQIDFASKMLDYEGKLAASKADIIKSEAMGNSWLQRSWRPITMLTFLGLVVADSFGWLHSALAPQAWTLLQIGLGGYVVGRSAEKVAPIVATALKGDPTKG